MYVPPGGGFKLHEFDTADELIRKLKELCAAAVLDPAGMRDAAVAVAHGRLLPITGDRARYLTLPDGSTVELHPGPKPPESGDPFSLVPDSWL